MTGLPKCASIAAPFARAALGKPERGARNRPGAGFGSCSLPGAALGVLSPDPAGGRGQPSPASRRGLSLPRFPGNVAGLGAERPALLSASFPRDSRIPQEKSLLPRDKDNSGIHPGIRKTPGSIPQPGQEFLARNAWKSGIDAAAASAGAFKARPSIICLYICIFIFLCSLFIFFSCGCWGLGRAFPPLRAAAACPEIRLFSPPQNRVDLP